MLKKICLKIVPHKLLHKTTTLTFKQHMGQSCPIKCKVHAFHVKGKPLFCNRHLTFKKQIFKYQFILLNSKAKPLLPLQVLVACSRVTFTFNSLSSSNLSWTYKTAIKKHTDTIFIFWTLSIM